MTGRPKYTGNPSQREHNPYSLAQRFGDVASRPPRVTREVAEAKGFEVRTVEHDLDELAVAASLAYHLQRMLPGMIHQALTGGATVDQLAEVTGFAPADITAAWLAHAERQRWLATQYPDMPDRTDQYARVAATLGVTLADEPQMPPTSRWTVGPER
ncbi:hypothetical protein [Actinoplanes sp. URMC 104]|uniref:hypothetical protein n=1 Tax=Actinoplanes sp. URMC 104 TaxID=3423409 RepID=UPI003F1BDDA3